MAINKEVAVSDGIQHKATPSILVFNKAYVNLYDMASILNYRIDWIEAEIGYFKVTANDKSYDFTLVLQYDDLMSQNRKYFCRVRYSIGWTVRLILYISMKRLKTIRASLVKGTAEQVSAARFSTMFTADPTGHNNSRAVSLCRSVPVSER